jgi:hypothetical protein
VISYILSESSQGRSRLDLSKLLYYGDAVFFQHHAEIITGERYIHIEDSPQPFQFYNAISDLVQNDKIEVKISVEAEKVGGFRLHSKNPMEFTIIKEEKRILNKVINAFPGSVVDENKQYPNLYEIGDSVKLSICMLVRICQLVHWGLATRRLPPKSQQATQPQANATRALGWPGRAPPVNGLPLGSCDES